ncbi:unnamed protein product [Musa hybrid cultivar]
MYSYSILNVPEGIRIAAWLVNEGFLIGLLGKLCFAGLSGACFLQLVLQLYAVCTTELDAGCCPYCLLASCYPPNNSTAIHVT